jgi:hypothetical protein
MKRTLIVLIAVAALAAVGFIGMERTQTSPVKLCRADAQRFADENASFDAEYDTQFGATAVGQLSMNSLLDRDKELIDCLRADPGNREQYRAVLYRNGFIEGDRFFRFVLDTKQLEDFSQWERGQQAVQLAKYHTPTQ